MLPIKLFYHASARAGQQLISKMKEDENLVGEDLSILSINVESKQVATVKASVFDPMDTDSEVVKKFFEDCYALYTKYTHIVFIITAFGQEIIAYDADLNPCEGFHLSDQFEHIPFDFSDFVQGDD